MWNEHPFAPSTLHHFLLNLPIEQAALPLVEPGSIAGPRCHAWEPLRGVAPLQPTPEISPGRDYRSLFVTLLKRLCSPTHCCFLRTHLLSLIWFLLLVALDPLPYPRRCCLSRPIVLGIYLHVQD